MSIDKGFPQPTTEELEAEPMFWKSFNPFWWRIIQGKIGEIAKSDLWDDYTEELDQAIKSLMQDDDPLEYAEWVHFEDFRTDQGVFSIASGEGTWASGIGFHAITVAGQRVVHIEANLSPVSGVTGLLLFFGNGSNVNTATLTIKVLQGATETTLHSSNPPTGLTQELTIEGTTYETVSRIRLRLESTITNGANVKFMRLILWGEGVNPF